jgi:5-oxoprolinase (ATP-hydrolysing) subunit A
MAGRIDLNCDMGESFGAYQTGADAEVLPFVSSVNLACGFHGGDPRVMDRSVAMAVRASVAIGAHPSHYDLRGFGRRPIKADPLEVEADVVYQVGALLAFVRSHGTQLVHVKPHGALYNQAAEDLELARAIARGIARISKELRYVGLATSTAMKKAAEEEGLVFAAEAFADRSYNPDGSLQSRKLDGALILDPAKAAAQAVMIARDRKVVAVDGKEVRLEADTLCLHGDNPSAEDNAWAVRKALDESGVEVRPLGR